ncbi:putative Phosphate regulon sensor histidine kinase PhoR [Nitrospira sp. KM1]|uniref:two-component system histidine kinase PnpS n=1 Tax=Nitrospira sp. KM1 TaxID=1936990 RepID=UPI0013A73651|nr:ATP-binding protein [Nitrospira sp. KM1]BCA55918.1 putative Phosphate regulon sensor histidine kinase PhoR [Nitrospira sp. KM1]
MTISIRWKVALATLLALICGFVIAGILAARSLEQQELTRSHLTLEVRTSLIAYQLRGLFPDLQAPAVRFQLQSVLRELGTRSLARVTLIASDGTVVADSAVQDRDLAAVENHRTRPEIEQAVATGTGTDLRASKTTGDRTLYRATRLHNANPSVQPLYLRLGLPMTTLDQEQATLKRNLALAFGSAFLLVVGLSVWLAGSLTRPLLDMASAAKRLAGGDHTVKIRVSSRDEVGLLADTLNQMADQLNTSIAEISDDRAQLLAMLTSMVEGVMVLDSAGRILQVNPALERMFGISKSQARGHHYSRAFRHPQLDAIVSRVLDGSTTEQEEILLDSGRCVHIEASAAGAQGEYDVCAIFIFHDVTELRRLESIRKDFVANVSHELRTPLTSIKGYVEALLDGAQDDPQSRTNFLHIILKQSDRLNLILEDLLQLSKIESGQVHFKREPLQIDSLIERTFSMIKPLADKKQHQLQAVGMVGLPLFSGDQERLLQVLANLVDNAIKYTPEGGTITVAARPIHNVGLPGHPQDMIEISVADTGIGIPEQDRPRIFERFYRVDKARSRELGGTGLGLAIVKHIVEGHGGQVWAEANSPTGSRFVVRLPIL